MSEIRYVCTGSCANEVSEEQFISGQNVCIDETCDQYGEPLERMMYCPACDEYFIREEEHAACE
jgi:hypothetical protein